MALLVSGMPDIALIDFLISDRGPMKTRIFGLVVLLAVSSISQAQQRSKIWVAPDGSKAIIDLRTGLTVEDKDGKEPTNIPALQLKGLCEEMDKQTAPSPALDLLSSPCEYWAELQPRTQIERVPFAELIARLLIVAPGGTDFARYRGMQISSDPTGVEYDSTIVPNDVGADVTSVVLAGDMPDRAVSMFKCTIKLHSYQEAIATRNRLVSRLASLKLTENQVDEHGIAAKARAKGRCAFSGECEGQHTYATIETDGRMLRIAADPDFTSNAIASLQAGRQIISGVSTDSATVTVKVFSVAPKTTSR